MLGGPSPGPPTQFSHDDLMPLMSQQIFLMVVLLGNGVNADRDGRGLTKKKASSIFDIMCRF